MANFITDEVLSEVMQTCKDHLWQHQEGIDTAFGDDAENRKVTVKLTVNLAGVGKTVTIKNTIDFTTDPGVPATKTKETSSRVYDPDQNDLPFVDNEG